LADRQRVDGTVVWTAPNGHSYTTHPGSRLLFPALRKPTAQVARVDMSTSQQGRELMMPRRKATRAQNRARAIAEERRFNEALIEADTAERHRPPPF